MKNHFLIFIIRYIKYSLWILIINPCFSSTQTQIESIASPSRATLRFVLHQAPIEKQINSQGEESHTSLEAQESCMHKLISLIDTLRNDLNAQSIEDIDGFVSWVETNIEERVREYINNNPLVAERLIENHRIELRLEPLEQASDENPILMIIDNWRHQTAQEAVISSILYPASIPMVGDECNHQNKQHLIRLALCAYYRNPFAYYHLSLWAHHHRPGAYGLARGNELSSQERLFSAAMKQFEISSSTENPHKYSDFQKRSLILCMRNLKPETAKRTPVELTESLENQDPRLLFNMGISGKKHNDKLVISKKRGFLPARFHQTRRLSKQERKIELQKLKRDLSIFERRTQMRNIGGDLLTHIETEVDNDLVCVGVNSRRDPISVDANENNGFSNEQVKQISDQVLKIMNK